ncbi:ABC transporter permease [Thiobacter aerophilum]|uniref:FtsX-like permease family protein n=1 Tax=Thiobacter aerophilum TaxID=3121275 RepID=A0ABV0ED03_9BURK
MTLALRLFLREWRAGELTVFVLALLVAVAAVTTVSFFTDRVNQALDRQASELLAADLVLASDHPIEAHREAQARALGLAVAHSAVFPSMVVAAGHAHLAEIKAVSEGYPLRGRLRITAATGKGMDVAHGPAPGTVWADARLMGALNLVPGNVIEVGRKALTLVAVLEREPDRAGDFFNIAPRLMMNEGDLPATGLITVGSRIRYRLLVAGQPRAVAAYRRAIEPKLARGERLEGVSDARPEIRSALERSRSYLGLAALVAAVLSSVALALAARRFVIRHLDACAIMRCLGAAQRRIFGLYFVQLLVLGAVGGLVGSLMGMAAQEVLARLLAGQLGLLLPLPGPMPLIEGMLLGAVLLTAFGVVPLARLARVPTLRVLRRELAPPTGLGRAGQALAVAVLAALFLWKAGEPRLALYVATGLGAVLGVAWLAASALLALVARLRSRAHGVLFYGLAAVTRRGESSRLVILAFAVGLMALLLVTLVRGDLLASWQRTLPANAPNRFLINVQPDQVSSLAHFMNQQGLAPPTFYPTVRGRLIAINDRPVRARDYADERSQRLVEREFNLSWASTLRSDNRVVAGRFWQAQTGLSQWSVEEGIAKTLGIRLGDRLRFDVAGTVVEAPVTNLRHVDWDSMRVNFFVIGTPGLLAGQPASYITSFHLPRGREAVLDALVRAFPNVSVIDVAAILEEVRGIMDRVAQTLEFVFLFTLLAGLMVLYAALVATRDERMYEAALMRALGARRGQLLLAQWLEFALIGALAGLVGAAGAAFVAWALAERVLDLPYTMNPMLWLIGVAAGCVGVAFAGVFATRRVLGTPPLTILRG